MAGLTSASSSKVKRYTQDISGASYKKRQAGRAGDAEEGVAISAAARPSKQGALWSGRASARSATIDLNPCRPRGNPHQTAIHWTCAIALGDTPMLSQDELRKRQPDWYRQKAMTSRVTRIEVTRLLLRR